MPRGDKNSNLRTFFRPLQNMPSSDNPPTPSAASDDSSTKDADLQARPYQDQLLEVALARNTIIYLPTGAGKTFVALMAIRRMSADLTRPLADGGRRSVFLVNTVVLANQQTECIRRATSFRVTKYTGEMNVDVWRRDDWLQQFELNQVLVATCQIILDVIRHGFVKLHQINLLIFDECHHGRSDHPMHQLMRLYSQLPPESASMPRPRIIGLTGMLIGASVRPDGVIAELEALEATFQSTIATVRTMDDLRNVMVFSTKPAEYVIKYLTGSGDAFESVIERVRKRVGVMVATIESWPFDSMHQATSRVQLRDQFQLGSTTKWLRSLLNDFVYQMTDLGLYGASIAIISVIIELELKKRSCDTRTMRPLLRLVLCFAERIRQELVHAVYEFADEDDQTDDTDTILSNSSNKMIHFLMYMRQFFEQQQRCAGAAGVDIKALVFVQRRHSAKCVFHVLQRYAKSLGLNISADFMVGVNNSIPESLVSIIDTKTTRDVVARFRRNELNVIVASSVLEEGIDLQDCNLVVSLDAPQTFRSYVQCMGRARMASSQYILFTSISDHSRQIIQLGEWREVQKRLRDYLIGRSHDRTGPLAEDVEREFQYSQTYRTPTGALLEDMSAVQLLNRYAGTMPNDAFTVSAINWRKTTVTGGAGDPARQIGSATVPVRIAVSIRLPMQSKVKETIVGELRDSLEAAKRAAAFRACVLLHKAGELNDNLMPINNRRCLQVVSDNYFAHWRQHEHDNVRDPGTRKTTRMHPLIWPAALHNCNPMSSTSTSFLYMLDMEPTFRPPSGAGADHTVAGVHRLLSNSQRRRFGILTSKRLPAIGRMQFYQHYGAIDVSVRAQPQVIPVASYAGLALRHAHECLFGDLLGTVQPFLVADKGAEHGRPAVNDFLIVPCNAAGQIDAEAIAVLLQLPEENALCNAGIPDESQRRLHRFEADAYVDAVVSPWYRSDRDTHYVVTRVCHEITPASPVNPSGGPSFAEYVKNKYVNNPPVNETTAFMLEVRGIAKQLNRLTPGAQADGSKGIGGGRAAHVQYFIPEMCQRFSVPADLWLQATLLPSVLHRLVHALHAEELRCDINEVLGIRQPPSADYRPEPILQKLAVLPPTTPKTAKPAPSGATIPANGLVDMTLKLQSLTVEDQYSTDLDDAFGFVETTDDGSHHPHHFEDSNAPPWENSEKPVDLVRDATDIYMVDLQYYMGFLEEHQPTASNMKNAPDGLQVGSTADLSCVTGASGSSGHEFFPIGLLDVTRHTDTDGPRQCDLMAALTTSRCADVFDGERLEVLGDAFLKFATSLFLLRQHTDWHEGHLSTCKGHMVSNKNLFYLAKQRQLGGRMKVVLFDPTSTWLPPAFRVPHALVDGMRAASLSPHLLAGFQATSEERQNGVITDERSVDFLQPLISNPPATVADTVKFVSQHQMLGQQRIPDKVMADAVEACLGATLRAVGIERTFVALRHWGVLPPSTISHSDALDLLCAPFINPRVRRDCTQRDIDDLLPNYALLERQLNYKFRDRAYLLQALTHPSFPANQLTDCYQQLEFLGDAVLDMLVTAHIYERCPHMQPGQLTDLRSALVNNVTLACVCVRHHIQRFLLSQSAQLTDQIESFVEFQNGHGHRVTDEVLLMRADDEVRMGHAIDVPKTLGDVMEALIGAVFLDSGNDMKRTWQVVWHLLGGEVKAFVERTPLQVVRELGEWTSAKATYDPPFVDDDIVMVTVRYTCRHKLAVGHGFGRSAAKATVAAAKVALNDLRAT